jgi:shikimate dehydrogenase
MTRPYAEVIGDPISHSKSPLIHNFWLGKLRIDAEYRATHVRPDQLADYFANRREDTAWRGCNVTIPHKEISVQFIDELLPGYLQIGAINCLVLRQSVLFGANTDVDGIIGPINSYIDTRFQHKTPPTQRVAIIGAGGAARAAAAAFRGCYPSWPLRILARRRDQARAMLDALSLHGEVAEIGSAALEGIDILVNASPLGMIGKPPLLLSLEGMGVAAAEKMVFEMVYAPLETPLLAEAHSSGFNTIDGLTMLVGQAAAAFHHFFSQPAPCEHDAELRALLTA